MNAPLTPAQHDSLQKSERQSQVVRALQAHLPAHALIWHAEDTTPYECDGLTAYRQRPLVVALPETEAQVAAVLKTCHGLGVPVVARGAGTGLSGGAMPHALGVTLSLAKFNRILKIDPVSRTAVVQCGVRNLAISEAAAPFNLYYAPDPSSQIACTIGGNVASRCTTCCACAASRPRARPSSSAARRSMHRGSTCLHWSSVAKACWP